MVVDLPEWWLEWINPLVTEYCVFKYGGVAECQTQVSGIFLVFVISVVDDDGCVCC